ncbi:DUF1016 domain-containing protein [Rickettsia parkeri]|nr:DUF1016 domain-containing protein [Rickettsia parkeri]
MPIELEGEDYYLDLVFYHVKLKCYIVIELKTGKFKLKLTEEFTYEIKKLFT